MREKHPAIAAVIVRYLSRLPSSVGSIRVGPIARQSMQILESYARRTHYYRVAAARGPGISSSLQGYGPFKATQSHLKPSKHPPRASLLDQDWGGRELECEKITMPGPARSR